MDEMLFARGKVAVVTGAAMGIGLAAATRFAELGMRVVLVDLPGADLDAAANTLMKVADHDDAILSVGVDLAEAGCVSRLHETVMERFGKVNVLMNNAVTREGRTFDGTLAQWRRSFDINLWAVVEAVRLFQPSMISSDERCAIINVGSKQGITNPPGTPAYNMAKSAIKTYTEQLEHALRSNEEIAGRVSSHLLVPGWTTTGKNEHKAGAWLPHQVVDYMIDAMANGDFYIICPDDDVSSEMDKKRIIWSAEDITENRPPLSRWHKDYKEVADKACS